MSRPRILKERGVVMHFYIESSLASMIEEIARRQKKSVSALVREVLVQWLEGEARVQLGLQLAAGREEGSGEDDPLDPLTEVDVEEFEQQLGRLEEEVAKLEEAVEAAVKGGLGYGYFAGSQSYELNNIAWKLTERWNTLRRWYYRLRRDLPARRAYRLSSRMASLKKRLNELLEKTRSRRW
jgi:hypothetical protein